MSYVKVRYKVTVEKLKVKLENQNCGDTIDKKHKLNLKLQISNSQPKIYGRLKMWLLWSVRPRVMAF